MPSKRHHITAHCLDKRGRIISTGINSYSKSHPIQAHYAKLVGQPERHFLHAEIAALLKAGDKQVHKIKVVRFDSKGNPANAEPCAICKAAIKAFGVKYIEHTT
jgi:deoxycytidylate deaminase